MDAHKRANRMRWGGGKNDRTRAYRLDQAGERGERYHRVSYHRLAELLRLPPAAAAAADTHHHHTRRHLHHTRRRSRAGHLPP